MFASLGCTSWPLCSVNLSFQPATGSASSQPFRRSVAPYAEPSQARDAIDYRFTRLPPPCVDSPAQRPSRPPKKRFSEFQLCDLAAEHADVARILESAEVQPQCSRATGWVSAAFLAAVRQALLVLLAKWLSLDAAEAAQALDFGHQSVDESGGDDDDEDNEFEE